MGKKSNQALDPGVRRIAYVVLLFLGLGLVAFIVGGLRSCLTEGESSLEGRTPQERAIWQHARRIDSLLSESELRARSESQHRQSARHPIVGVRDLRATFVDLNDLQLETAQVLGIPPLATRAELEDLGDKLVNISELRHVSLLEPMTHSVPYLVPRAARLLEHIAESFRDSLILKGLSPRHLVVTSVLRSEEDIQRLRKGNGNASANSTHRYGTTVDISWKRFRDATTGEDLNDERYKMVLAEVLRDYRELGACYVVYERRQACFHLTAR